MANKNLSFPKLKRKITPYLPVIVRVFAVTLIGLFFYFIIKTLPVIISKLHALSPGPRTLFSLIQTPENILQNTSQRTNILILGKGGAGHEAPDLTDTIIFISYHHPSGNALMLSLPRDIWIDSLQAKINSAYYYGNIKKAGGGLVLSAAAVEEVIDQPIHYSIAIDFSAFKQAIDFLGGINVNVSHEFTDEKYPIPGKENVLPISARYETIHFNQGIQTMDGATALKFARSRNAQSEEGTDYARAARQQQVIKAFQGKLKELKIFLNPKASIQLFHILSSSVDTNIKDGDIIAFIKLALRFNQHKLYSYTLDQGDEETGREGLLVHPPEENFNNQWVLTGQNKDWQQIHQYVLKLLEETAQL